MKLFVAPILFQISGPWAVMSRADRFLLIKGNLLDILVQMGRPEINNKH